MKATDPPGPPPLPPEDLGRRRLPVGTVTPGDPLFRIHRSHLDPIFFGNNFYSSLRPPPSSLSSGVCYLAVDGRIAFAETMLRDLSIEAIHQEDLELRSINFVEVITPLRLVEMNGAGLRRLGADASVVQARYDVTQAWSAALHDHPDDVDGIRYRARHDDSGFSIALFERARKKIRAGVSIGLNDRTFAPVLAGWLDHYEIGLTS